MEHRFVVAVLSILLFFTSQISALPAPTVLCIESSDRCGNYSRCDECHTLEYYLSGDHSLITSNSEFAFLNQRYFVNKTVFLENMSNLLLGGYNRKAIIRCTEEDAGFKFQNISNLTLSNLQFISCGATFLNYFKRGHNRTMDRASLVILLGANLTLTNISILNGSDAGIIVIDVRGNTFISHLTVSKTRATQRQAYGNEIAYFDCRNKSNTNYKLIVQDSNFTENHCYSRNKAYQVAGLTIFVSKCFARINITRTQFINNSGTHLGGNLAIIYLNLTDISAQHFNLSNILIEGGNATGGAGLYIFITKLITKHAKTSVLPQTDFSNITQTYKFNSSATVIENVIFKNNVAANVGAAIYIQLKASTQEAIVHHKIIIRNCKFYNNSLTFANNGGVALYSNYFDIDGFLFQVNPQYKIVVSNSHFQGHYVDSNHSDSVESASGNSVIFVNSNNYFEIEDVNITNNSVNAITAINSNLLFKGSITLFYNTGSSGGGLLLCQNSIMYLTANTTIRIFNNSVSHVGGGICVEPHCVQARPQCFFQVDNQIKNNSDLLKSIHVHIHNNIASYGGHNLFGGDVDRCYMTDSPELNSSPFSGQKVYNTIFSISNGTSSVTSEPRHICFCMNGTSNCSQQSSMFSIYPGESFMIEAVLVGQQNGTVPGVVQTWLWAEDTSEIQFKGNVQTITHQCSYLNYTISLRAADHRNQTVHFEIGVQHVGDQSGYERLPEFKRKQVVLHIKDCPIGFKLESDSSEANSLICGHCILQYKDLECHIEVNNRVFIKRKQSGNVWIGFDYNGTNDSKPTSIKHIMNCPFDYCDIECLELNMTQSDYNPTLICANNRSGIGCGGCKEGHSALLGSSKCGKCTNKYLALLLIFVLAGFALVVALTLLNLTIAKGTLSGLIFYANVIESNISFLVPHKKYNVFPTPLLRVFVAWINLDLGIPTCFYDGMDAYAEAWLQFAFPLYIWGIAILIILLSSRFQCVATIVSKNAVKVLATLVLLSYTTFIRAVISSFSYADIYTLYRDNSTESCNYSHTREVAWLIDSNVRYFEFKHALLFAVAIVFGLITLPFTFVLLFIKPLRRYSHKMPLRWLERLKPFLDAYTGPYSDSGRFWPGMLLLARICLSITGGLNTLSAKRVIQNVTSLVIITLLSAAGLVRPGLYRVRVLDALEYFFLLNLAALLIGVTYYDGSESHQKAVFDVCVGLSFIVFIAIVLYHLGLKIWKCTWMATAFQTLLINSQQKITNSYPPIFEEREPLLAVLEDHVE